MSAAAAQRTGTFLRDQASSNARERESPPKPSPTRTASSGHLAFVASSSTRSPSAITSSAGARRPWAATRRIVRTSGLSLLVSLGIIRGPFTAHGGDQCRHAPPTNTNGCRPNLPPVGLTARIGGSLQEGRSRVLRTSPNDSFHRKVAVVHQRLCQGTGRRLIRI